MNQESGKVVFMAIAGGRTVTEGAGGFAKYKGLGAFTVLAVNPNKASLEKIYGADLEKEPEYLGKTDDGKEKIRISFLLNSVPENNGGAEFTVPLNYFLENKPRYNAAGDKVQVINKYGETTWVTLENAKAGTVPANMSWYELPYRPAFVGEEDLVKFIKAFLNIPNKSFRKADGTVVELPNKADAECRFDTIKNWFGGNVKELEDAVKYQPDNKVKLAIGVKTTDDNREYQAIYSQMPLKYGVNDYSKLDAAIKDRQANGAYPNTVFSVEPLHVHDANQTPTNFGGGNEGGTVDDFFNN